MDCFSIAAKATPCQLWAGALDKDGYPSNHEHRRALARKLGRPIGRGLEALHSCDNRACLNEDHLSEGTHAANIAERDARGRTQRGAKHYNAKLTEADVVAIRRRATCETLAAIAADFGVRPASVRKIVIGENWKHVPGALARGRLSIRQARRLFGVAESLRATRATGPLSRSGLRSALGGAS